MDLNRHFWLEAEVPAATQAPASDATPMPQNPQVATPADASQPPPEDNVENDPTNPDVPEDKEVDDFETWRHDFMELSIKGDTNEMMSSINQVKDMEGLEPSQNKFIIDNLQILFYRQDDMVLPVTKEIRRLIKDDLDRTNPGVTVIQHITTVLEEHGLLQQVLIKLTGLFGLKNDLHRKFIASLVGGVQVGGGHKKEDIVFTDKDYTINLSTRFATQFGDIELGTWNLKEDDPDKYLADPEMQRLQDGAPEEKQVLRRRIVCEAIADKYDKRAFIVHVVHVDGTIFSMGLDFGTSLKDAYKKGKVIVRGQKSEVRDALITDNGEIVPSIDYELLYIKETGEVDENGKPEMVEVPFVKRRDSVLYLTADIETIQNAAATMSGMFFREMPYNGNPSDLNVIRNCVPDLVELLNKRCIGNTVPLPSNVAKMGTNSPKPPKEKIGPGQGGII